MCLFSLDFTPIADIEIQTFFYVRAVFFFFMLSRYGGAQAELAMRVGHMHTHPFVTGKLQSKVFFAPYINYIWLSAQYGA